MSRRVSKSEPMGPKVTPGQRWDRLQLSVVNCRACPRLVAHRENVAEQKRAAFREQDYWGRAVPDFGRPARPLLIVGLAPGAHGANRTGRLFTGDRSGDWLYRAMHKSGFASQGESVDREDGLKLKHCAITNICRCVPPDNKPTRDELIKCRSFLLETIDLVRPRVYLALGQMAWKAILALRSERSEFENLSPVPKFFHGNCIQLNKTGSRYPKWLIGSYHPSQQNTFTGRLTEAMFDQVFADIKQLIGL